MQCGVACVTASGNTRMHLWFVDNLDTQLQVRMMGVQSSIITSASMV